MPRPPTKDAAGILLRAGIVPLDAYPGAAKPWPCLCIDCGAEVSPTVLNVKARGGGCKHCVGRQVSAVSEERKRQLVALMNAAGFRPIAPYPGLRGPLAVRLPHVRRRGGAAVGERATREGMLELWAGEGVAGATRQGRRTPRDGAAIGRLVTRRRDDGRRATTVRVLAGKDYGEGADGVCSVSVDAGTTPPPRRHP